MSNSLNNFDYTQLITPTVTIISIFISNYLGRRSEIKRFKFENKVETYQKYHINLIKRILNINPESRTFFWSVALTRALSFNKRIPQNVNSDWLLEHLYHNLEFAPPEVVKLYREYISKSDSSKLFFHLNSDGSYQQKYYSSLEAASRLFDKIIIESLTESVKLSKEIGYPNIAQDILDNFLDNMSSVEENHRVLPEEFQTSLPTVHVGDRPPFY